MSPTLLSILKKMGGLARSEEFFLTQSPGWIAMTQATVTKYLRELHAGGYVMKVRSGYMRTEKGRTLTDAPGASSAPTRHVNASQPNMHKLPHEMKSHRPGANDALEIASHGTRC